MKDIFSKLIFNILKNYITFTMIYQFLSERMNIEKVEKLVGNLCDKAEYVIHINLKQAVNHGLVLKKMLRIIKFKRKALLKSYIDMNTDLRKKGKYDFEKVFGKTMENVRKHRDIKLVTTKKTKLCGVRTKLSYYKNFSQKICWLQKSKNADTY